MQEIHTTFQESKETVEIAETMYLREDIFLTILYFLGSSAMPYENEYGPGYGEEWIMFLDDNGINHTMNFSTLPSDTRGMMFGDAYFYLYTRQNNNSENLKLPEDGTLIKSNYFNSSNYLKIVTHGWYSGADAKWIQNLKNAILDIEDANIITVDWSELAVNPLYPWSACSTRYVGKRTAQLLNTLAKSYQIKNVHLIGYSLGAHVMGYTGMFTNVTVNRITGLDPARPLFEMPHMAPNFRLDKSDAEFVDIIHTCGGIYGYKRSHGHADFYPNNGKPRQPGCEGIQQAIEGCSHDRSTKYYTESIISNTPFVAYPCDNWAKFERGECKENSTIMGYTASACRVGDFYLYTNGAPPYALEETDAYGQYAAL